MTEQRKALKFQADQIEAVLAAHGAPGRVTGGTVTPRWVRFQVLPAVGAKISKIKNLSEELAAALDAPTCRVSRRGAAVAVEVPRDDPQPVRLLPLYEQLVGQPKTNKSVISSVTAILGLAEDGAPLLVRLPSADVGHILITGDEGVGKTMLLRSIALSLAMTNEPDSLAIFLPGDTLLEVKQALAQMGFGTREGDATAVIIADDVNNIPPEVLARVLASHPNFHYVFAWDGEPPKEVTNLFKVRLEGQGEAGDFVAVFGEQRMRFQAAHISPEEIQKIAAAQGAIRCN